MTDDERLLAALSRRGSLRIGQFISAALDRCHATRGGVVHDCAQGVPDRDFVEACEYYAEQFGL